ncbi:MAG: hypothetical protein PHI98_02535 [Eubacteriales bacterium]|nr:hypothetical protein [Eubacteriales bacterium]
MTTQKALTFLVCLLCLTLLCAIAVAQDFGTVGDVRTLYDDLLDQERAGSMGVTIPTCDKPAGCAHIAIDEQGNATALCPFGQWLLSADEMGVMFMASSEIDLPLTNGETHMIYRSGTYRVTGGDGATTLIVTQGRAVSLLFDGATVGTLRLSDGATAGISMKNGAVVSTVVPVNAQLEPVDAVQLGTLAAGGLTVSGDGVLSVGQLNAELSAASTGSFILRYGAVGADALKNLQEITPKQSGAVFQLPLTASYQGQPLPLVFLADETGASKAFAPLSKPTSGNAYKATFQEGKCTVALEREPDTFLIDQSTLSISSSGMLRSTDNAVGNVETSGSIALEAWGAKTAGSFTVHPGAAVDMRLYGTCSFGQMIVAGTLTLKGNGVLTVANGSGSGTVAVDEQTNLRIEAEPAELNGKKPTKITVVGMAGQPVANTRLLLKLGNGESFTTTTDGAGRITLWRSEKISSVDVVALSGNDTYAAIISGGQADVDALPEITSVNVSKTGVVNVKATGAKTIGVQYILSDKEQELRDAYQAGAQWILCDAEGKATIPGVKEGDIVTLRAYAAKDEGATLSPETTDAFAFSAKQIISITEKKVFSLGTQRMTYDSMPFSFKAGVLPKEREIVFYRNGKQIDHTNVVEVGDYTAKITVKNTDPDYQPGVYEVSITIDRLRINVYPFGDYKVKGQPDPEILYMTDPLLNGDEVAGGLRRMKGEGYGNYPYYVDGLYAVDENNKKVYHYQFIIPEGSPYFFIDWNIHHYLPFNPLDRIDPVYDELHFGDGSTLSVQRRTSEMLNLGGTYFGTLVTDLTNGGGKPFIPSLRMKKGEDRALLILTADAELDKDGGYATDADGKRLWQGRALTLGYWHVAQLKRKHIEEVAFSLNGASVLFSLDDLNGDAVNQLMEAADMPKRNTAFRFELEPILSIASLGEGEESATNLLLNQQSLVRVRVFVENQKNRIEITEALPSAKLVLDAGELLRTKEKAEASDITETVNGKTSEELEKAKQTDEESAAVKGVLGEGETNGELLELAYRLLEDKIQKENQALQLFVNGQAQALDSTIVVPYTASETATMQYAALMRTKPFVIAPLRQGGLYGLGINVAD